MEEKFAKVYIRMPRALHLWYKRRALEIQEWEGRFMSINELILRHLEDGIIQDEREKGEEV